MQWQLRWQLWNFARPTPLCWAFACLALLNFLNLGGEWNEKFVGMISVFNIFLDGRKPSSMDQSEMITAHNWIVLFC